MITEEQSSKKISVSFFLVTIYLAIVFFEPQQFFPALKGIRLAYTFGIFVVCWVVITSSIEIKKNLLVSPSFWLMSIFSGLYILGIYLSEFPRERGYIEVLKVFSLFLMVAFSIKNYSDFIKLCWILLIFSTINASVTIYYYHQGILPTRMTSYFGGLGQSGSNELALLMLEMLPFAVILLQMKQSKLQKGLLLYSLLTYLYCLTRTRSRAGFLGLIVITILLFFFRYLQKKHLIYVLLACALIFYKSPSSYFERMFTAFEDQVYVSDTNIVSRIDNYKRALTIIQEHPLFGIGWGNFMRYVRLHTDSGHRKIFTIHNSYLKVAVESGLFSMFIFILLLLETLRQLRRCLGVISEQNTLVGFRAFINSTIVATMAYSWMALSLSVEFHRVLFVIIGLGSSVSHFAISQQANKP